jgi:hypothetical protein
MDTDEEGHHNGCSVGADIDEETDQGTDNMLTTCACASDWMN